MRLDWSWSRKTQARLFVESLLVTFSGAAIVSHHVALANATAVLEMEPPIEANILDHAWQWMLQGAKQRGLNEHAVFTVGLFLAHTGTFTLMNGALALIDHFGLFQRYKIQQEVYPDWSLIKEALQRQVVSHLVLMPLVAYLLYPYTAVPANMSILGPLPPMSTMLWQLAVSFVINDTLFYFVHRLFHHRRIYKYIHKEHHRFRVTIGIAAEFAHPIEEVFANLIPTLLGPFAIGAHFSVLLLWLVLRLAETIDTHSGYQFPWSITQIMDGAKRHDYHHSHNVGMYGGILLFWDWLFGTDKPFLEHRAKLLAKKAL